MGRELAIDAMARLRACAPSPVPHEAPHSPLASVRSTPAVPTSWLAGRAAQSSPALPAQNTPADVADDDGERFIKGWPRIRGKRTREEAYGEILPRQSDAPTQGHVKREEQQTPPPSRSRLRLPASPPTAGQAKIVADRLIGHDFESPKLQDKLAQAEIDAKEAGYDGLMTEAQLQCEMPNASAELRPLLVKLQKLMHEATKCRISITRGEETATSLGFEGYFSAEADLKILTLGPSLI